MARYRVTAAAVVAKVDDQRREVYLYRNMTLPPAVSVTEAERLVRRGLAVKLEAPEPEEAPAAAEAADDAPESEKKPQARKPAAK